VWLSVGLATLLLAPVAGQTAAAPSFEVATVKPNKSGEPFIRIQVLAGGRVDIQNAPVAELIWIAYGVQPFQLDGGLGGSVPTDSTSSPKPIESSPPVDRVRCSSR